jgi:CubicO group peptidase (beta-lactamase class C family)
MTAAGLSAGGLVRLHDALAGHVEDGECPGVVTLVARGDDVHIDVIGSPSFESPTRLEQSATFRIASLTKPITGAVAMSLVDEGVLRLDQAVDDLLPELADRKVLRSIDAELDDVVPAARSITVEDLLSSRMGFGSVMAAPDSYPIQRAEAAAGLQSIGGPPWPPVKHDVDSWMAALGELPLMAQPGEQWLYNTSSQVLGALVARAADRDLATVMRERIFEPLGMRDTGFTVPADQLHRLPPLYVSDPETGALSVLDNPANSWWSTPPSWPDGSGGLVSTIDDFWLFVEMLLGGGTLRGTRVLSPESVALMTTDRLTPAQREAAGIFLEEDLGWGLGMAAPATGSTAPLPCGFGWAGGSGTTWRTNPRSGATGILFTQRQANSPDPPPLMNDFFAGINTALT